MRRIFFLLAFLLNSVGAEAEGASIDLLLSDVKDKDLAESGLAPITEAREEKKLEEKEESDDCKKKVGHGEHINQINEYMLGAILLLIVQNFEVKVGAKVEDASIEVLLIEVKGKDLAKLIASGREKLAAVPCCGGGVVVAISPVGAAVAGSK
ncbi:60S acidic ribosomal protein P2-4 [Spatholobus suberectus]|nr:60S acidic ribosomal protein P2-4 [Spatholobus suberectus]